jgi:GAF domain-containing protein
MADDRDTRIAQLEAELRQAREQQAATSEILRVISNSPTDVQPVFDAIVSSARRLLDAVGANVARLVGDELHLAAFTTVGQAADDAMRATYPMPINGWIVAARAVRAGAPVYVADAETDAEYRAYGHAVTRARGVRSIVAVPMISQRKVVGTIAIPRRDLGAFSDKEIALLETFADQAVIAIENGRLFQALNESNASLREALEQQTATADVLRVIASSPADVQAVPDELVTSLKRLGQADGAFVYRVEGDEMVFIASTDPDGQGHRQPFAGSMGGEAFRDMRTVAVHGSREELMERYPGSRGARLGYSAVAVTPLVRDGRPFGVLAMGASRSGRSVNVRSR